MSLTQNRNSPMQNKLILTTAVPVDDQFSSPRQIRWSAALGKLLVANLNSFMIHYRNYDLSFFGKYTSSYYYMAVDGDSTNLYTCNYVAFTKRDLTGISGASFTLNGGRMIDASGDPLHVYVTSNNATDGHGVRKVRKSDMTVVASILATGAGDGQFTDPLGIFYYNGYVYVANHPAGDYRIDKLNASDLSFVTTVCEVDAYDLCTDGTNWYVNDGTTSIKKYDMSFTEGTVVSVACVNYSLCIIPDQSDGYGATLGIVDSTKSHLERRKCSDLSLITTVGTSGDGVNTLCDPQVTGPAGTWTDSEGGRYAVASAADISKNGFSGDFFRGPLNRMTYQPTGKLPDITAIDFNADAIQGEIKNLYKCVNMTSLKGQTNPAWVCNLSRLSAKLQTLWAYACGAGISGSIRHMTALTSVNLRENAATQAQVDAWISDLYANKDIMAPGTANFNGSNSTPSAVGKSQADELVADYSWSITYTA